MDTFVADLEEKSQHCVHKQLTTWNDLMQHDHFVILCVQTAV